MIMEIIGCFWLKYYNVFFNIIPYPLIQNGSVRISANKFTENYREQYKSNKNNLFFVNELYYESNIYDIGYFDNVSIIKIYSGTFR